MAGRRHSRRLRRRAGPLDRVGRRRRDDLRRPRGAAAPADRAGEHGLFGEALHGARHRGRARRREPVPVLGRCEKGGVVRIGIAGREFTPPEISAFVLRELKRRAEDHFREQGEFDFEVDRAVITVPATSTTRSAPHRDAGRLAASRCCASSTSRPPPRWRTGSTSATAAPFAVYDLGGGTFDISILKVEDGLPGARDQRRHAPWETISIAC